MTPLRQAFHAAVVAAGLSIALPTQADPLAPVGPPTAAEAEAEAAALAAAAKPAPAPAPVLAAPKAAATNAKSPAWLAPKPAPKPATGRSALPSSGRVAGLLLVLGALGAATLYFKRRGRGADTKRAALPERLRVLSSTRIGPKAHAVVITVAGRQMLLGVTDSSVKRLAFIDELEEDRDQEPARLRATDITPPARSAAAAPRAAEPAAAQGRSFSDMLRTAFKKRPVEVETDAALVLAAETQDVLAGKPVASNVRMLDVEGQAQGLVRRLSGPRA
jgi:flagellar biogenesis protein FliO